MKPVDTKAVQYFEWATVMPEIVAQMLIIGNPKAKKICSS
jgi:hypothetical protein